MRKGATQNEETQQDERARRRSDEEKSDRPTPHDLYAALVGFSITAVEVAEEIMKQTLPAVICALLLSCSAEPPRTVVQSSAAQPKWMREERTKIEPSREVKKLIADDPDVKKQLTAEEIKATLAAAAQSESRPVLPPNEFRTLGSDGKWQQMENDQKAHNQAYRDRLAQTGVYVAPGDDYYHTAGCGALFVYSMINGISDGRRQFVGNMITLATAKDRGMKRHADCGAPSYEFSR